jgi:murein DD-endopeptidase MepM/ murein hydrolase activator NlpD
MQMNLFRRGKKFFNHSFTFLIVPPRGIKTKTVKVPGWLLIISCLLLIILISVTISGAFWLQKMRSERAELHHLRQVNESQQQELLAIKKEALDAQSYLEEVKGLDSQIREMTGLNGNRGENSSRSGSRDSARRMRLDLLGSLFKEHQQEDLEPDAVAAEVVAARKEAAEVLQNMEQLEQDLESHFKYLAALPDHWPVQGEITSNFGSRQSPFGGGRTEFHDGLDLAANYGDPVTAAGSGVVVFVGYRPGYGRTVIISHGYGYRSSYCHLSGYLVKDGDSVKKGQRIALIGNSGRSTGPHLHFMVEKDGVLIDPLKVLKDK